MATGSGVGGHLRHLRHLHLHRFAWGLLLGWAMLLAGCAHRPVSPDTGATAGNWTGRLALQVENEPSQSFSAGFELKGDARSGELTLFNPLGGTLALLAWAPGTATLRSGSQVRAFDSIDALVAQAIGTAVPVTALFDWLAGTPTPVPGWQPDLSQLATGRLLATRLAPVPQAWLRLALDR